MKKVLGMVKRIRDINPWSPLIVGGDFNKFYKEISREMQDLGYDDVFKSECTFKRSSNTLDAIFTNLPVRRKTIKEVGYSDHHML